MARTREPPRTRRQSGDAPPSRRRARAADAPAGDCVGAARFAAGRGRDRAAVAVTVDDRAARDGGPSIAAVLFVVVLPVVCLAVDPEVFRPRHSESFAMFAPAWAIRAQFLWLVAVLALVVGWVLLRVRGRAAAAVLAALAGIH